MYFELESHVSGSTSKKLVSMGSRSSNLLEFFVVSDCSVICTAVSAIIARLGHSIYLPSPTIAVNIAFLVEQGTAGSNNASDMSSSERYHSWPFNLAEAALEILG